jgi:hypothetical protein
MTRIALLLIGLAWWAPADGASLPLGGAGLGYDGQYLWGCAGGTDVTSCPQPSVGLFWAFEGEITPHPGDQRGDRRARRI